MSQKSISLGVRAIIKKNDSFIVVEHNEEKHGKFFIFPGGGIENGETIFEATQREVLEETNLNVRANKIVYIRETRLGKDTGIEFYVLCEFIDGEMKLGSDPELSDNKQVLTKLKALSIDELNNEKWYPEELNDILQNDNIKGFEEFRYLGLKSFD